MDRVATRAGVGKAALYRRWPSKQAMLVDVVARVGTRIALPAWRCCSTRSQAA